MKKKPAVIDVGDAAATIILNLQVNIDFSWRKSGDMLRKIRVVFAQLGFFKNNIPWRWAKLYMDVTTVAGSLFNSCLIDCDDGRK